MKQASIMIAAASSGSGKTVISCALMSAFAKRGLRVAACKCGPDYIDPMFHREVLGVESENLDLFFCEAEVLKGLYREHTAGADVTITEGVMGYYDGRSLESEEGSSYDVARTLDIPVILVVPCRGMARSVIPSILGMLTFCGDSRIRGILLNRISGGLYPRMKELIESELSARGYNIPVAGYVPEDAVFTLKSRHLGLVTPQEITAIRSRLRKAGELLAKTVDLELLLQIGAACTAEAQEKPSAKAHVQEVTGKKIPIGIAWDEAFCFYYKDNLRYLETLGCELVRFSPLRDECLPEGIRGLLLGGGYPELYAGRLAENAKMRRAVRQAVEAGMPCIAECGGFMYLHRELLGEDGVSYPMAGVIPGRAVRQDRLVRFGYVEIQALREGMFLQEGESIRGHEFHYWDSTDNGSDCLAVKPDKRRSWECIHMKGSLFAGYPHIHFYANPLFAQRFVKCCGLGERGGEDAVGR